MTAQPSGDNAPLLANLLVVDDDEAVRHMLTHMLSREGYSVHAAPSGHKALEILTSSPIDVVLCDVRMKGMDGLELLDRILELQPDMTVILMSAYGSVDQALEAIKRGAYDYISKPFKKDEVVFCLRKAEERERLRRENKRLRDRLSEDMGMGDFVGQSPQMQKVFRTLRKMAEYKTTVLITGESGTGKELAARSIHNLSTRRNGPFVAVNCGAIPGQLLESELFGHRKGAFTHATRDKKGLFEEADQGTLFLDEIGELPLELQVKLLRVLQEGRIRRLGDTKTIEIDVRIVAATSRNLAQMVQEGAFRNDLYYRLAVLPVHMPPLREHIEDVPLLVHSFLKILSRQFGKKVASVHPAAMRILMEYDWPGNVRQLQNVVQHAMVMAEGDEIRLEDLPSNFHHGRTETTDGDFRIEGLSVKKNSKALERILIGRALAQTGGNRTQAAKLLEISHRALLYKIREYDLDQRHQTTKPGKNTKEDRQ